ncbi:MAG: GNAT family N-acetyltransferase [Chloroflexi bacterium]|nr:GNAT family N-acetyltransferase [Chloroflexota bacterium]
MAYRQAELLRPDHQAAGFQCEEPALTEWLKRHALVAQASGSARVYVVTTETAPTTVVGSYALAAASVASEDATERALRGQPRERPVPAILLARLARDDRHRAAGLGASLLQDGLLRASQAADAIGARVLLVHAKHERARAFYQRYGFEDSPTDPLHLMLLMKDVRRYLKAQGR